MKTNKPNGADLPLSALLREWKSPPPLPPRFQEQVWRRIERAETAPAPSIPLATIFANWIATMLPRPALAAAYLALLFAVGAGVGWSQARLETARVATDLGARYVQAVDPYLATP